MHLFEVFDLFKRGWKKPCTWPDSNARLLGNEAWAQLLCNNHCLGLGAASPEGIESSFDCNPFNCTFYSFLKEESAIWLTANATPVNESNAVENDDDDSGKVVDEKLYLDGTKVSFATFELKTSSVSVCIIDDCKDADVPLLDFTMNHLHLSHKVTGAGRASASFSGWCSTHTKC